MRINIKNKIIIIFCAIIIVLLAILIAKICIHKRVNSTIKSNAYIDIWKDNTMDVDIDLYSIGTGENEKLYLGVQPVHYLINKNGDVYTYQNSSYQNKKTGKRDPATVKYIKRLSLSDLENLENDLKSIIENNSNSISTTSIYWYIVINDKSTRVYQDVLMQVLDNYL